MFFFDFPTAALEKTNATLREATWLSHYGMVDVIDVDLSWWNYNFPKMVY